jgi:hypothetical protein
METQERIDTRLSISKEQGRKTILLVRWILIIVVGYLTVFSNPGQPFMALANLFVVLYVLSNLFLIFCPKEWFEKDTFVYFILLFDIGMTSSAIYISARIDSEFYVIYFLILFIASITRKAKFLYFSSGLILTGYALYSYFTRPLFFREPFFLLRFSFILIIPFFFNRMIESYNRLRQEKEILNEDYRELEVLTELAQSIGHNKKIGDYLVKLNKILSEKLLLDRCTSILVDRQGREARICFSDDNPANDLISIDLGKTPSFKESLHKNLEHPSEGINPDGIAVSRYMLKEIPLFYHEESLGVLYLRVNTPHLRLTHREEYFLARLSEITATALYNLEKLKTPPNAKPEKDMVYDFAQ